MGVVHYQVLTWRRVFLATHSHMDYVLIRSYGSDLEAELARAVLETNGIPAVVRRADAAGILRAVQPADLLVPESDLAEAEALLESPPEPES